MKKGTKILLTVIIILIVSGSVLAAAGYIKGARIEHLIDNGLWDVTITDDKYSNPFKEGSIYEIPAAGIHQISADWIAGDIILTTNKGKNIILKESAEDKITDKNCLGYAVENGKLQISAVKTRKIVDFSGIKRKDVTKKIIISVPEHIDLKEVSFDTVSSDIYVEGAGIEKFETDTVSGNVYARFPFVPEETEIDSTTGNASIKIPGNSSFEAELESVSGKLHTEFQGKSISGKHFISGDGNNEIEMDSVSGNLRIEKIE